MITSAQLEHALAQHRQTNRRLGDSLVSAGYVTEQQIAHGLRLQQLLLRVALAVLLAVSSPSGVATAASGGTPHNAITLSATVLPYHQLEVLRQNATLTVTQADIERGYVDVAAGTSLRARSNDQRGFTVNFDPRMRLFDRATIAGFGGDVEIGATGGAANYRYGGRDTSLHLSYRFYLASGLGPGSYPWPLQISSSITY
jgi:hypothetical protein